MKPPSVPLPEPVAAPGLAGRPSRAQVERLWFLRKRDEYREQLVRLAGRQAAEVVASGDLAGGMARLGWVEGLRQAPVRLFRDARKGLLWTAREWRRRQRRKRRSA